MPRQKTKFTKSKTPRKKTAKYPYKSALLLFVIGILLVISSVLWQIHEERILSFDASSIKTTTKISGSPPVKIQISKVLLSLSVKESAIVNGVWQINPTGASHLATSARPGNPGNIIIYGHNKDSLFGPIRWLNKNDQITLTAQNGKTYFYTVIATETVDPSDISVLNPTKDQTLTLYTCTGFADLKRFVAIAKRTK